MRSYLLTSLLFGFCVTVVADTIPTVNATFLNGYKTQSGVSYSAGAAGSSWAGSAGTGPNDLYPANAPIPLGFGLPGTNLSLGSPMLTVSGPFTIPGGAVETAVYFGLANVSPVGAATFMPSGRSGTYAFPITATGSFVACGVPGYQLCEATTGQPSPNAPVLGNVVVDLTGTEILTIEPASDPNLITYRLDVNASVPEPGSLGLMLSASTCAFLVPYLGRRRAALRPDSKR